MLGLGIVLLILGLIFRYFIGSIGDLLLVLGVILVVVALFMGLARS